MSIPPSWLVTTLGTVRVDRSKNINPFKEPETSYVLFSVPQFEAGTPERVRGVSIGSTKQTVENGTVLLCKINPRINRVWVVKNLSKDQLIASTEWIPFFPVTGVYPEYLAYFLQQKEIRDFLAHNASGVGGSLMRVRPAVVDRMEFRLAPSSEQVRIVAELEKQFTRLDDAVAGLKRVQANLKRYRASVLKAACEGRLVPTEAELARKENRNYEPASELLKRILNERRAKWQFYQHAKTAASGKPVKNDGWKRKYKEPAPPDSSNLPEIPKGWVWASMEELLREPLRNGHSAKEVHSGVGIRALTLTAVTLGSFSEKNTKLTVAKADKVFDLWLRYGDILIERSNTPELVGIGRLYRGPDNFAIFPDLIIRARLTAGADPSYVEAVLLADKTRSYFRHAAQGISGTMPKIDQSTIERLALPFPPEAEQTRIADELERQMSEISAGEVEIKRGIQRASTLRQAILKHAFEGKLASQDPADEPASIFVERIRAERETPKPTDNRRARRMRLKDLPVVEEAR